MEQIKVTSAKELRQVLAKFGKQVLFRGQVSHYLKNGHPSVVTSFDRKGCIPSQMQKWIRYARNVLDVYLGIADQSLDFNQALLQHYGWRSFYVDCSSSAAVSAWFASHVYSDKRAFELCEDCDERPVMLVKRMAGYNYVVGEGHLYVFDKQITEKCIGVINLETINIESTRLRTMAQDAWLLGPLRNREVPPECFIAHITASREVFRDFAAEEGLTETYQLFPTTKDDPILRALLGLPWKKIEKPDDKLGIPFFNRALDLPEYHDSFTKIASPGTAFFQGARIADQFKIEEFGIILLVPEISIFGTADEAPLRFPRVCELLAKHPRAAFEVDDLIQHVNMQGMVTYQKGIVLTRHGSNLIELGELVVEHPGLEMTGFGTNKGWFFRIDEVGLWKREFNSEQCDCGNDSVHNRHISALHIVNAYLAAPNDFE